MQTNRQKNILNILVNIITICIFADLKSANLTWLKLKSLISVKAAGTNRLNGWVNAQAASSGILLLKRY